MGRARTAVCGLRFCFFIHHLITIRRGTNTLSERALSCFTAAAATGCIAPYLRPRRRPLRPPAACLLRRWQRAGPIDSSRAARRAPGEGRLGVGVGLGVYLGLVRGRVRVRAGAGVRARANIRAVHLVRLVRLVRLHTHYTHQSQRYPSSLGSDRCRDRRRRAARRPPCD